MKKINLLFLFICSLTYAQNKQVLYGFSEIPQSLLINPGSEVDYKWHIGIPLLSQIHANFGSSGVTINDIFADNNTNFNTKLSRVVSNVSDSDFFTLNQQLEIFSGGLSIGNSYKKDGYLSFGLYQETDIIVYFPKDLAVLALEGNQNNINRVFDLSDLSLSGELISVLHLGYNKKVNKKLTYGLRGKIYSSLASFRSTRNKGSFVTRPGENNFFDHIFELDLELQTSGIISLLEDDNSDVSDDIATFRKNFLLGGNLGLGFDIGFTYHFSNQLYVDGSLQDVGFISHSKDVETYSLQGDLVFEGVNPLFPARGNDPSADEFADEIANDFEDLFEIDRTASKFVTIRPIKLNAAIRYNFEKKTEKECNCLNNEDEYLNSAGAQLYVINRPRQPQFALTAFYYRKLFNTLKAKITYTVDSFSFNNVGLGVSAHFGAFNFYIAADNLLAYQNLANAKSLSLQLGFNIIFNNEN